MARLSRPSQFSDAAIPMSQAISLCGPAAAIAFSSQNGRTPTLREAMELASAVGWTAENGMAGPASEQALLARMGVQARLDTNPSWDAIHQQVSQGKPVIVSTPTHYWTVDDFDPATGRYHVGTSGTDMRGGAEWMTQQDIAALGQGVNGALYVDRPTVNPEAGSPLAPEPPIPRSQPAPAPTPTQAQPYQFKGEEADYLLSHNRQMPDAGRRGAYVEAPAQPPQPSDADYMAMLRSLSPDFGSTPQVPLNTQPSYTLPLQSRGGYGLPSLAEMTGVG